MAAALRRCFGREYSSFRIFRRSFIGDSGKTEFKRKVNSCLLAGGVGSLCITGYLYAKSRGFSLQYPVLLAKDKKDAKIERPLVSYREQRFLTFASVELDGNVYMTPQDFLESVTEEHPRPRIGRTKLDKKEVERQLRGTPNHHRGSDKFFRSLHTKGVISYTEYLFLLCVLTKPYSGFRIAFNMFDTDGNRRVDKKEFLVLANLLIAPSKREQGREELLEFGFTFNKAQTVASEMQLEYKRNIWQTLSGQTNPRLEQIITEHKLKMAASSEIDDVDYPKESVPVPVQETTLLVHFFGTKGTDTLNYEAFHRFMDNLQTEVLQLEFSEFSKGMPTISEEEFARVLLRYTTLSSEDYTEYLLRLKSRILQSKGISFGDFKDFCQFLNNLDDFAIAMTMYTFADQPISQAEFQRAVHVCTGKNLNSHVVDTVFQLFDIDGDGHLSHKEFISIMKDRLHRGFRSHLLKQSSWESFKNCVKNEMRNA